MVSIQRCHVFCGTPGTPHGKLSHSPTMSGGFTNIIPNMNIPNFINLYWGWVYYGLLWNINVCDPPHEDNSFRRDSEIPTLVFCGPAMDMDHRLKCSPAFWRAGGGETCELARRVTNFASKKMRVQWDKLKLFKYLQVVLGQNSRPGPQIYSINHLISEVLSFRPYPSGFGARYGKIFQVAFSDSAPTWNKRNRRFLAGEQNPSKSLVIWCNLWPCCVLW